MMFDIPFFFTVNCVKGLTNAYQMFCQLKIVISFFIGVRPDPVASHLPKLSLMYLRHRHCRIIDNQNVQPQPVAFACHAGHQF